MTITVGVMSDTHDRVDNAQRAAKQLRDLGASIIIHLGDIVAPFTLKAVLDAIDGTAFYGVLGNNDGEKLGLLAVAGEYRATITDPPLMVEIEGARLLLVHGFGSPQTTREIVEALALSGKWQAVLYGHTHESHVETLENGVLILNPGEAGGVLKTPSVAVMKIRGGEVIEAEVIKL